MPTSNPTGAESRSAPGSVSIDAELAARLVGALEMIGSAFKLDEVNDARALALIARLAGQGGGGADPAGTADPVRVRAARDYDVLRGLLGRDGAPRPLRMHRERAGDDNSVVGDPVPGSARTAVVESPGDGSSGPLTESFTVVGGSTTNLSLTDILPTMPISRVEVFDEVDVLVAFGPSLPPILISIL